MPDVINVSFGIAVLKGLRAKMNWDHYKKFCLMNKTHLELWEEMIDWGIEKKPTHP